MTESVIADNENQVEEARKQLVNLRTQWARRDQAFGVSGLHQAFPERSRYEAQLAAIRKVSDKEG